MSKYLLLALVCSVFLCTVQAQSLVFIFAHGRYDANALNNSTKSSYSFGAGAEAGLGIGFRHIFLTGTVGYTFFDGRSGNKVGNQTYTPVKAGIRYYLPLPLKILFVNADLGAAILKNKDINYSSTRPVADAGAGVKLGGFELLANIDAINENSVTGWAPWFNVKAGFRIGL